MTILKKMIECKSITSIQKETGYNANNAASALYNQQWTAGSQGRYDYDFERKAGDMVNSALDRIRGY